MSKKVLCETLRHLERDGLVTRRPEIYQSAVEYSLTAVDQSLCTALEAVHQWAAENATAVETSRQRFDAAHGAALTADPVRIVRPAFMPFPTRPVRG